MGSYWGYHLILDCGNCLASAVRDRPTIIRFSKTLVQRIEMVAFGIPQVVHFGTGDKAGYSLVQLIETSNICAHFVEETNDVYLDVFSCKKFDRSMVRNVVEEFFRPTHMHEHYLERKAPSPFGVHPQIPVNTPKLR